MRRVGVGAALALAVVASVVAPGKSAVAATVGGGTYSCTLPYPAVWVRVAGQANSSWRRIAARLEPNRAAALVYTRGVRARTGTVVLGGVTVRTRQLAEARCERVSPLRAASTDALRRPVTMKSGWFADEEFTCAVTGRVLVHMHPIRRNGRHLGNYLSLRTAAGQMLATAHATRTTARVRVARRCATA